VSGSGKSTVGAAVAQRLRVPFADADDFHPPANIAKMTSGQSLDDDDRQPWLEAIGEWLDAAHPGGGVMSCSALKRKYRDQLPPPRPGRRVPPPRGQPRGHRRRQAKPTRPLQFRRRCSPPQFFATLEPLEAQTSNGQ
jgi:gluconokinase